MTNHQIERFDRAKAKEDEIPEEDSEKQQLKGYLPSYLKKVEDEKDVLESTIEELTEINLDLEDSEKKVLVGTQLTKEEKEKMTECLKRNSDIFACSHRDIPRVDPEKAEHCLNIDPAHPPVRQKQRRFTLEWNKVISDEIDMLLEIDAIEPCQYPKWLSNVVVVKKKNGKWRVYRFHESN